MKYDRSPIAGKCMVKKLINFQFILGIRMDRIMPIFKFEQEVSSMQTCISRFSCDALLD